LQNHCARAALQPLRRSDPRYLEAMLTGLETSHGDVLPYLEAELGVGEVELQLLKDALLETA
jgi:Tyrosine phosphatase family